MMTGVRRCRDLLVEPDQEDPRGWIVVAVCHHYPHPGNHQGLRIRQGDTVMEQWENWLDGGEPAAPLPGS